MIKGSIVSTERFKKKSSLIIYFYALIEKGDNKDTFFLCVYNRYIFTA